LPEELAVQEGMQIKDSQLQLDMLQYHCHFDGKKV